MMLIASVEAFMYMCKNVWSVDSECEYYIWLLVNLQILFKFRPREAGRYTQYWQLNMEPLAACSDSVKVLLKFELCGQVGTFRLLFSKPKLNWFCISVALIEDCVLGAVCWQSVCLLSQPPSWTHPSHQYMVRCCVY